MSRVLYFVVLLLCVGWVYPLGYTFPTRWQATVSWWVKDGGTNHQRVDALAYIFTDYSNGSQRVDQLYDYSTSYGTPGIGDLGIECDHHLQASKMHYYYYSNGTGSYCYPLPISDPFPTQNLFPASTFVGTATYHNIQANVYKAIVPIGPIGNTTATLWQDKTSLLPLGLAMAGIPPYDFFGPNEMFFLDFKTMSSWPHNNPLFSVPSFCGSN